MAGRSSAADEGVGLPSAAMANEVSQLRAVAEAAPVLAWREDAAGVIIWANAAYRARVVKAGDAQPWPLPPLFAPGDGTGRQQARGAGPGNEGWFDLSDIPAGDGRLRFAVPADTAVRAEAQRREFVQTLSRTFADLPIGLAVFDSQRRLQVFNPALTDLTTLSGSFLTSRPSFEDVLDRLREARMIPEPKDYRSWRQRMGALETAASSGHHVETWSLPGGQIYRVTGRPHPGGAIAFLIEDITTGISLTRGFRAEIDLGREVLDRLDQPLCVLTRDGGVALMNAACRAMVGDPGATGTRWDHLLADATDAESVGLQAAMTGHVGWSGALRLAGGAAASAAVTPMSGGMSLMRLSAGAPATASAPIGSAARAARELAAVSRRKAKAPASVGQPAPVVAPSAMPLLTPPLVPLRHADTMAAGLV